MSIIRHESGLHVTQAPDESMTPEQSESARAWLTAMLHVEYERIHRSASVLVQRIPGSGPTILELAGRRVPYHGPRLTMALEAESHRPYR